MKSKFPKLLVSCLLALVGFSGLARAEKNQQNIRLGVGFDQLENFRQSLNLSYRLFDSNMFAGLLVGHQGFRELKENDRYEVRAARDFAATLSSELVVYDQLMLTTGLELGMRRVPKRDDGKSKDHMYLTFEEKVGVKQGSIFVFLGVGYRSNFAGVTNPDFLGSEEIPLQTVYPRIGVDFAL